MLLLLLLIPLLLSLVNFPADKLDNTLINKFAVDIKMNNGFKSLEKTPLDKCRSMYVWLPPFKNWRNIGNATKEQERQNFQYKFDVHQKMIFGMIYDLNMYHSYKNSSNSQMESKQYFKEKNRKNMVTIYKFKNEITNNLKKCDNLYADEETYVGGKFALSIATPRSIRDRADYMFECMNVLKELQGYV